MRKSDSDLFFAFSESPFGLTSNPKCFYRSQQHTGALTCLTKAIEKCTGLVILTGEPGTGKTTTLACLREHLKDQDIKFIFLSYPRVNVQDFFEMIALDLNLPRGCKSKAEVLDALHQAILEQSQDGRTVVLIVDEAHLLQHDVLAEIGLLAGLEGPRGKLLQVVLAGQPELNAILDAPYLRAVKEQVVLCSQLHSFTLRDTVAYIRFRLERAGMPQQTVFPEELMIEIHARSGGIPRLINSMCASLLQAACAESSKVCTIQMLDRVCQTMHFEQPEVEEATPVTARDIFNDLHEAALRQKPRRVSLAAPLWRYTADFRRAVSHPRTVIFATLLMFGFAVQPSLDTLAKAVGERAAVALDEDFRTGLDGWQSRDKAGTGWSFDQTGFVRPGQLALYRPTARLSDYEMEFLGLIDKKALSWVVRAADFDNYYVVKLVVEKKGPIPAIGVTRYAVVNGKPGPATHTNAALNARADTLYHVHLNLQGDSFALAAQDSVIDTWSEPRLRHGGIGFFAAKGEASRVRWVRVTHQFDTLGRLCASLAMFKMPFTRTF